jgi:hypothetical protein
MSDNNYYELEVSSTHPTTPILNNFGIAMDRVLSGFVMRRLSWPDDGTVVAMHNDILSIFIPTDKQWHPLMVSIADIAGEDWVTVSPPRVN